jgi:hypothetical protein
MTKQFQKLAVEILINISSYINIIYVGVFAYSQGLFPASCDHSNGWLVKVWPQPAVASLGYFPFAALRVRMTSIYEGSYISSFGLWTQNYKHYGNVQCSMNRYKEGMI